MKKIILPLFLVGLMAAGCNLQPAVEPSSKLTQKDLMQYQDTCHNWGKTIKENKVLRANPQIYTHYNTALQKCFVESVSTDYFGSSGSSSDDILYDGESGKMIISLNILTGTKFLETAFDYRPVNGVEVMNTLTTEQFRTLKNQYMNE